MLLLLAFALFRAESDPLAKAGAAYDSGKFEQAAALYKAAARSGSNSAIAWFNYGNCQARLEHRGEAAAAWRKSLEWAPRFKRARLNLAILSEEDGEVGTALVEYQRLWELDPKDPLPALRMGEIRLGQGDPMGGIEWFQKALEADQKSVSAYEGLVRATKASGDTSSAKLWLWRWEESTSDTNASDLFRRAVLGEQIGDYESARRACEGALSLDRTRVDGWLLLARILQKNGSDASAESVLKQATTYLEKEPRLWRALGAAAFRAQDGEGSFRALQTARSLGDPGAGNLLERLANWHEQRGEMALARRARFATEAFRPE